MAPPAFTVAPSPISASVRCVTSITAIEPEIAIFFFSSVFAFCSSGGSGWSGSGASSERSSTAADVSKDSDSSAFANTSTRPREVTPAPAAISAFTALLLSTHAKDADRPKLPLDPARASLFGTPATKAVSFSNSATSIGRALLKPSSGFGSPAVPADAPTEVCASSASEAVTLTLPASVTVPPSEAVIVVVFTSTAMPDEAMPSLKELPVADTSIDLAPVASTASDAAFSITAALPTVVSARWFAMPTAKAKFAYSLAVDSMLL